MTHEQILMQELAKRGHVTYRELTEQYANGYTYSGFVQAAWRARRRGLIVGPREHNGHIVRVGTCPCCGGRYDDAYSNL